MQLAIFLPFISRRPCFQKGGVVVVFALSLLFIIVRNYFSPFRVAFLMSSARWQENYAANYKKKIEWLY